MARLKISEALAQLNNASFAQSYFLLGKEKFFHDQFIQLIIEKIFPERASRDLNLTILYGSENSLSELISACLSFPMLAERKLVIVRDFDKMKISDPEALKKYLENPQKSCCLVLSASEKGRAKIYDQVIQLSQTIECAPIPEYKVGDWISNHCREKGLTIESQAVQFLINLMGADLLSLDQELNKIIDFKNDTSAITIDDLEQTTGISKEANVFALQKALANRQLENSLKIANRLLDTGTDITMVNAVLFAFFRKVLQASSLQSKNLSRAQIAEQMKIRTFQMKEVDSGLSRFNMAQLQKIIGFLHEVDVKSKTTSSSQSAMLQMLCYKICRV